MIVNMNIAVDSASPVSFLKQNVLHEIKLRYPNLKIHPVEKRIKDLYCRFTNDTINILGKIIIRTQSNGWISEDTPFFITGGHERNILGNDNLPKLGIEITQRKCPQPICMVNQPTLESEYKNLSSLSDKIFNEFKDVFTRVGKIPNDRKVTHFHSPLKPIQSKGRRVPLHLLAGVNEKLKKNRNRRSHSKTREMRWRLFYQPNWNYSEKGYLDKTGVRLQFIKRSSF